MTENVVVVLATLDSKSAEAGFLYDTLADAGVTPLLIDMSLRPHGVEGAGVPGGDLAVAAGTDWKAMAAMDRTEAAKAMVAGGINILLAKCGQVFSSASGGPKAA